MAGVGVTLTILYVHGQIDRLGEDYVSFCSINDSINCDRVLSSSYSKLLGLPVAWFALASYLGLAGLFGIASRRTDDASVSRLLALGFLGLIGAFVFSGYMAVVSLYRLETVCLLCISLYTVATINAGLGIAAARASSGSGSTLRAGQAALFFAACVAAVTALAYFTWPRVTAALDSNIRSGADVRSARPLFYDWYMALPTVPPETLLREDQAAKIDQSKVVIVDFFDLECAHCRKNYHLVKELVARRAGQVEVVHRHFPLDATCNDVVPLSLHRNACRAAEAVECAGLQGKHDEMLDILFANQGQLFAENLTRLGGKIGLDTKTLQLCLDQHTTLPLILADSRAGGKLEITSTPTVFINGRRVKGTLEEVDKYEMAVLVESSPAP